MIMSFIPIESYNNVFNSCCLCFNLPAVKDFEGFLCSSRRPSNRIVKKVKDHLIDITFLQLCFHVLFLRFNLLAVKDLRKCNSSQKI